MSAPTPLANAATPAATAPTPGVAPSPVIPTVAVFSPVVSALVYFDYVALIVVIRRNASLRVCDTFVLTPDGLMQDVIRYNFFWILGLSVLEMRTGSAPFCLCACYLSCLVPYFLFFKSV